MKDIFLLIFISVPFVASVLGQTSADFEKKYGSKTYFEIRPHVLMSAEFDKNGQVCRVSLQPNRISKKTNTTYLGQNSLDLTELKEAFDELVPAEQRRGELDTNGGFMFSGGMYWGTLDYENISVGVKGVWRTTEAVRQIDFCQVFGKEINDTNKPKNFFCSTTGSLEVVTVVWTERTCIQN